MLQSLRRVTSQLYKTTPHPPPATQTSASRDFHKEYNAKREEQTFQLADGRTMGFAEYGNIERGTPAFFLHGSPGSRYDGVAYLDAAKSLNVHIICPDRPGHGLSTFQPKRRLVDYPNDISQLAKHLRMAKYHVFGQSGGGPYVVSCAHGLPQDELLNSVVVAGIGPPESMTLKDAGLYTYAMMAFAKWAPSILTSIANYAVADEKRIEKALAQASQLLTEEDQDHLSAPHIQAEILASMKAAYAQGAAGAIRDAQIYASPWEFRLEDIPRKITLFWGCKDTRSPLNEGRYLQNHLPNAELVEWEDATHFNMDRYNEEILKKLLENQV